MNNENNEIYITCIGVDEKLHKCTPQADVCKCGVAIKSKKLNKNDYKRYSCYDCDV